MLEKREGSISHCGWSRVSGGMVGERAKRNGVGQTLQGLEVIIRTLPIYQNVYFGHSL